MATATTCGVWKKGHVLPTFLPQDNLCTSLETPLSNAVRFANGDIKLLLQLPFAEFFHLVVYDESLKKFLDSFLRFRRRRYDPGTADEPSDLIELTRRVLMVYSRIVDAESLELQQRLTILQCLFDGNVSFSPLVFTGHLTDYRTVKCFMRTG